MAEEVWKDVGAIAVPLVKKKIKEQVIVALQNKVDFQAVISSLRSNLIARFYAFDFRDLLLSLS